MVTYDKEKMRLWMRDRRIQRRLEGLCISCGSYPIVEGKTECRACRSRKKRNYEARKQEETNDRPR